MTEHIQEIADLTSSMVRLAAPSTVKLIGKGQKARIVPLMERQTDILSRYMVENKLNSPKANEYPLFPGKRGEKLTRAGITYILAKYAKITRAQDASLIPLRLSPHCHSKAMHLLQSGVNLVYIRDLRGNVSVQITEIYAGTDSQKKREAIEQAYTHVMSPAAKPQWEGNPDLIE